MKTTKKTLSPDKIVSLFKLYVVYNYKYPNSDVDVTNEFYSIDLMEERANGYNYYPDGDADKFLGVNYFRTFVDKLAVEKKLKKAMIYVNRGTREQRVELIRITPTVQAPPVQAYKPQQFAKEPMSIASLIK